MNFQFFYSTHFIVFLISMVMVFIAAPFIIPILKKLKFGQTVRDDGPLSHLKKTGTPTIGGIIFLIPIVLVSLYFILTGLYPKILPLLLVTLAFGAIGFIDDMIKVLKKSQYGLRAYQKMILILMVSTGFALYMVFSQKFNLDINFFGFDITFGKSWVYVLIVVLIFAIITNSVNLTDGLDGLASGVTYIVMIFFVVLAMAGNSNDYIRVFSSIVAGGCIGFLGFNMYPAKVFMGDTGSLALGGAVAGVAVMTGMPLIIFVAGAVYIIEALSVIIQVVSFKATGKRVFKMAPIHHHFELSGFKETKIVYMFWIATLVFCILGYMGYILNVF